MKRSATPNAAGHLALVLLSASAGCDLAPKYEPPVTAIPEAYKETGPWQPATPADTLPRGPWWRMYQDPQLDRLETSLVAANPDLAAAAAHYDIARAAAAQTRAGLFPTVFAGAFALGTGHPISSQSYRTVITGNYFGYNTANAEVQYDVDLWDQIHNQVAAGKASAQATAADLVNAQLSLQVALATAYINLRGLDEEAKVLADTVATYGKALQIVRNRFAGLIGSGLDVSRASTEFESARATQQDVVAQRALYEHAIASLIGRPASDFSIAPAVFNIPIPSIPTGVPSVLLQRRPDIASAERQVAAANAQIGVARAAFYPDLTLGLTGGVENTGWLWLAATPFSYWSIGPKLIAPLFEGGLRHAQLAGAEAQLRQTSEQYRSVVLTAFQQVEDALSLLNNLGQESTAAQAAVTDATHTLDMSMALYMDGAVNYLEVAVAQEQLLTQQVTAISLQTRRQLTSVQLIRALGGGWSVEELPTGRSLFLYTNDPAPEANGPQP
jgi:NodT family efflux transporter outer membrane factor (OMF) lipoprotein